MTPLELLALVCLLGIVRAAIGIVPAPVAAGPKPAWRPVAREYLDSFIIAALVALFLITFVVRSFFIPSASMEPTLQIHDVLLVDEFGYRLRPPHDEDIAVFTPPVPSPDDFIKRVIASPGDTLRIHDGIVYRNGIALHEAYIAQKPDYELQIKNYGIYVDGSRLDAQDANVPPRSKWSSPNRVPAGCYFMLGDNRNDSDDSHVWGFAQTAGTFASGELKGHHASFTGRAFLIFWPLRRLRLLG